MSTHVGTDLIPAASTEVSSRYRGYVLGVLLLVMTFSWVDRQIFAIVLESIKKEFSFSDTQLGLLGGVAFGLFYATVAIPVAWLADRSNRRNIIAIALALWSAMTALCGLASGFVQLFLARMFVGVGEAGGSAPSQSLLSDYFPPERRGLAMGILFTHMPIGYFVALHIGGQLNESFGWRSTFIALGIPGVLVALLVFLTVRELSRGNSERIRPRESAPSMVDCLRYFLSRPALRHLPIGGAINAIGMGAAGVWLPAYFIRVHGMTSAEAGASLGLIMGGVGLVGTLTGGFLADHLARRFDDVRWYAWVPAGALALSVPFAALTYTWPTASGALLFYIAPTLLTNMMLGPIVATTQNLAGVRRRAMIAACYGFFVNLISMALGPLAIGMASDYFNARYGNDSLRYALLFLVCGTCAWSAVHFLLAGKTIRMDMELAKQS
jgi:MFS family permease